MVGDDDILGSWLYAGLCDVDGLSEGEKLLDGNCDVVGLLEIDGAREVLGPVEGIDVGIDVG